MWEVTPAVSDLSYCHWRDFRSYVEHCFKNQNNPLSKALCALFAFSGLKLQETRLTLGDLTEFTVTNSQVGTSATPAKIVIRDRSNIPTHCSFLSSEGCAYLAEYLRYTCIDTPKYHDLYLGAPHTGRLVFNQKLIARQKLSHIAKISRTYFLMSLLKAQSERRTDLTIDAIKFLAGYPEESTVRLFNEPEIDQIRNQYASIEDEYFATRPRETSEKLPDLSWAMRIAEEEHERRTGAHKRSLCC